MGDSKQPAAQRALVLHLPDRMVRPQQRFLQQILRQMSVPGFEIETAEHEARRAAHQFLERSAVAALSAQYQSLFRLDHRGAHTSKDDHSPPSARRFRVSDPHHSKKTGYPTPRSAVLAPEPIARLALG